MALRRRPDRAARAHLGGGRGRHGAGALGAVPPPRHARPRELGGRAASSTAAEAFHARPMPGAARARPVWVCEPTGPALVLGSTQPTRSSTARPAPRRGSTWCGGAAAEGRCSWCPARCSGSTSRPRGRPAVGRRRRAGLRAGSATRGPARWPTWGSTADVHRGRLRARPAGRTSSASPGSARVRCTVRRAQGRRASPSAAPGPAPGSSAPPSLRWDPERSARRCWRLSDRPSAAEPPAVAARRRGVRPRAPPRRPAPPATWPPPASCATRSP